MIVGGFLVAEDLDPVIADLFQGLRHRPQAVLHMEEKRAAAPGRRTTTRHYREENGRERLGKSAKGDQLDKARRRSSSSAMTRLRPLRAAACNAVRNEIEALRKPYADDPEFQKYEAYRDDGIDLARLDLSRRCAACAATCSYIFQDPYSSLNPRMTVGQIISEGMQAHNMTARKKDARMQEMVLQIMDDCGLAPYFLHRYPAPVLRRPAAAYRHCPRACRESEVRRLRRGRLRAGRVHSGADHQPAAGPEGAAASDLHVHHPRPVRRQVHLRPRRRHVPRQRWSSWQRLTRSSITPSIRTPRRCSTPSRPRIPSARRSLSILEGDIPSPVNPPKGCKFHTRCKYCTEICTQVVPEWEEVRPNHFVACHHKLEVKE